MTSRFIGFTVPLRPIEDTGMRIALLLLPLLALVAGPPAARAEITATILHSFTGADGYQPRGPLVDGGDGYLYGTTALGGSGATNPAGTVYGITPQGDLHTVYTFDFQVTGDAPWDGILRLGDGTFFGTTRGSGAYVGNVFTIGTESGFENLHTFSGYFGGADGGHPEARPTEGADGNLYGTTSDGGSTNVGTLYRIDAGGGYTLLHSFNGSGNAQDGGYPRSALVLGDDDALYGTTSEGGPTQPTQSSGTVFRFVPGVAGVATLHAFRASDGANPNTLVKGLDGKLYGTTTAGGANSQGTVFQIATNGDFATLHAFSFAEGNSPTGLIMGSDGALYGTTYSGGKGLGTVFRLRLNGDFATLFAFDPADIIHGGGSSPQGPLVQVGETLYGTTFLGGEGGKGTVFAVSGVTVPEPATGAGAAAALGLGLARRMRRRRRCAS